MKLSLVESRSFEKGKLQKPQSRKSGEYRCQEQPKKNWDENIPSCF